MAIQRDGRIVAAGEGGRAKGPSAVALVRYRRTGKLDRSFAKAGRVTTSFGSDIAGASAVAVRRDGRLTAVGSVFDSQRGVFALARYKPSGALERTFENEGRVRTFFGDGRYGRLLHSLSSQTGSCSRRA